MSAVEIREAELAEGIGVSVRLLRDFRQAELAEGEWRRDEKTGAIMLGEKAVKRIRANFGLETQDGSGQGPGLQDGGTPRVAAPAVARVVRLPVNKNIVLGALMPDGAIIRVDVRRTKKALKVKQMIEVVHVQADLWKLAKVTR
jgi:hypothetical protein